MVLVLIILVVFGAWVWWNYHRIHTAAKFISNDEFSTLIHNNQLLDIRSPEAFRKRHILGARNFPAVQLKQTLVSLKKDKPILIYDNAKSSSLGNAVLLLRKSGFKEIYVLKDGFEYWNGKTK